LRNDRRKIMIVNQIHSHLTLAYTTLMFTIRESNEPVNEPD